MRKIVLLSLLSGFAAGSYAVSSVSAVRVGETNPSTAAYVFGTGEQLSGQQFQTDGIISYNGYQYAVYYNITRNVCIARRKMPVGGWEEVVLPYKNAVDDAHNVICMGICHKDGSIHLSYDHHNDKLHYSYSVVGSANDPENMPWETSSFAPTTDVMDKAVDNVTYPRFISKPDGNLLFECRYRWSGYGDSYLREYDGDTKSWKLIGRYVQGEDVKPDACAYINGMTYDNQGKIHITWCWRDDFGGGTNHDFYYAYSEDDGYTWKDTYGAHVATTEKMDPIFSNTTGTCLGQTKKSLMIEAIPYNKGYINQETQGVDSKGRIHAVNSHIPMNSGTDSNWGSSRTKARLHHRYRDTDGTWKTIQIKNGSSTVNSYCRVNLSFDKYDNAYVIANGAEVYAATADKNYEDWDILSAVDKGRFVSEPLTDRQLLMNEGVLSFVYLGLDKKITVIDYLTQNPNTPSGEGLLAEYYGEENFKNLLGSQVVSNTNEGAVPEGTKSIRWTGTFETLKGEKYKLHLNTDSQTKVYVNDALAKTIEKSDVAADYDFEYNLIASHKNNIVIESNSAMLPSLSWSGANTEKELIPATSLYSEKANGMPGATTAPVLPGKTELENIVLGEIKAFEGTEKNVLNIAGFNPTKEYSLEFKAKVTSTSGRGLDFEARNKNGQGFRLSIDGSGINNSSNTASLSRLAWIDTDIERTYRFAVKNNNVYIYCDNEYVAAAPITSIKNINADDTESDAAVYGDNIMPYWAGQANAGSGKPNDYGWECEGNAPWNNANVSGGVRFVDNSNHSYNGGKYNGRLMTIRWDADDIRNSYYSFPVTLEENCSYELSFVYELWANANAGASMNIGVSTTKNGNGIINSETFATGAQNTLVDGKLKFTTNEAGKYYLVFAGNARAMYGIGGFELRKYSSEPALIIGKNYNGGSLTANVNYVSYQDGAFAASENDEPVIIPELTKKKTLQTIIVPETEIAGIDGSKNIFNIPFTPTGNYSVEVSATVNSCVGRGLDIEVRDASEKGFRTSLSDNSFRWIAPFEDDIQIVKSEGVKEVIRYAVENETVHIYKNNEYLNSYALAVIGNMNGSGTIEEFATTEKPADIHDKNNLIAEPDFASSVHNGAPAKWVSDIALGGGTNPRIQEKSQTTELSAYEAGKKAFMIRYDGAATYFSYPVTLKVNTGYEYSFDAITWGTNSNAQFEVVISTSKEGTTGVIASATASSHESRAMPKRNSIRFTTSDAENETYYLTFKKIGSVGTIGITDLYLTEKEVRNILFGKNYTAGSADIKVDYIAVDYSGAFAPDEDNTETGVENINGNDIKVYSVNETVYVESYSLISSVIVYDYMGRIVIDSKCNNNTYKAILNKGLYFVKVRNEKNEETVKLLVK